MRTGARARKCDVPPVEQIQPTRALFSDHSACAEKLPVGHIVGQAVVLGVQVGGECGDVPRVAVAVAVVVVVGRE